MKKSILLLFLTIVFAFITCSKESSTPKYTITFNSNGGSKIDPLTVSPGSTISAPTPPTKTNCTFAGWYSDAGFNTIFDFKNTIKATITLYAKWTINPVITFNSNGGSDVASQNVSPGTLAIEPPAPTKTGSTFGGWYSDMPLTKPFDFNTPITTDITLYAKWNINHYTITFNSNGGDPVPNINADYNTTISAPAAPARLGYSFMNWFSDMALTSEFDFATKITADITLYAKWAFIPVVSTLVGSSAGFANGTSVSNVMFNFPLGIAINASGNVYVADHNNSRIRQIDNITPTGSHVITLAGDGNTNFADGDGTVAQFNEPTGVAADAMGNVYVADYSNHRIRMITATGFVTTLAGDGNAGYADDPIGTKARFNNPSGVAVDGSGNVYVADAGNHRIRKISTTGEVTTLAGSATTGDIDGTGTSAQFNKPYGIAVDASGTLYVTDSGNHNIRMITTGGMVSTLAGSSGTTGSADGTGTNAQFNEPRGIAVGTNGTLYVADYNNNRIRKITSGGIVTNLVGSISGSREGALPIATFSTPSGVVIDANGNLYVSDSGNNRIRKIQLQP